MGVLLTGAADWGLTDQGHGQGKLPADWGQGRAAFGGLVASVGIGAMRACGLDDAFLQSAQVAFLGPLETEQPAQVQANILRRGRTIAWAEANFTQAGTPRAKLLAAFGADRSSALVVPGPIMPSVAGPEGLPSMPFRPGVMPAFTQHFDYRWTVPHLPFQGGAEAHVQGWVRPRGPTVFGGHLLLALMDAWPPPIWSIHDRPSPGSSVTWQADLFPPSHTPAADAFFLYDARTVRAGGGSSVFSAHLWSPAGQLLAIAQQRFAEFSGR